MTISGYSFSTHTKAPRPGVVAVGEEHTTGERHVIHAIATDSMELAIDHLDGHPMLRCDAPGASRLIACHATRDVPEARDVCSDILRGTAGPFLG